MRINDAPTVEVDLRASIFSILLAVAGQPIPADPYAASDLAAFDREAVKAFFTQALNGGGLPVRWSPDFPETVRGVSLRCIRDAAVRTYPVLPGAARFLPSDLAGKLQMARGEVGWGLGQWLVGIEAEIMEGALTRLMDAGVIALPLHDALIVQQADAEGARRSLVESFEHRVGAIPRVKIKGACSES